MPVGLAPAAPASRLAVLVLLVALLVGLQFRLSVVLGTKVDAPLRADAGQYFAYAYNLRHHGVYSARRYFIFRASSLTCDDGTDAVSFQQP